MRAPFTYTAVMRMAAKIRFGFQLPFASRQFAVLTPSSAARLSRSSSDMAPSSSAENVTKSPGSGRGNSPAFP